MYAYCGNNPVNRVDSTGRCWIAIGFIIKLALACVVKRAPKVKFKPFSNLENQYEIVKDQTNNEQIVYEVKTSIMSGDDDEYYRKITDLIANEIENNYAGFLEKDRKVDRAQLFAEIKFHAIAWDCYILTENAKEAHIIIKKDGSVYDDRPLVRWFSKFYRSDYYE